MDSVRLFCAKNLALIHFGVWSLVVLCPVVYVQFDMSGDNPLPWPVVVGLVFLPLPVIASLLARKQPQPTRQRMVQNYLRFSPWVAAWLWVGSIFIFISALRVREILKVE